MNQSPLPPARACVERIARAVLAATLLCALPARAVDPRAPDAAWKVIDLQDAQLFAARGAVASAAPDAGPGAIRLSAPEDPPPLFDYPGLGRQICDNCTFIHLRGLRFDDGVIEVDIKSERTSPGELEQKGFAGLVFNLDAAMTGWESVYFRPHNAVTPGAEGKSVQYVRMPMENWFTLRGGSVAVKDGELVDTTDHAKVDIEKASAYEGTAKGIAPGQWFTARVVIAGSKVAAFVRPEGASAFTPALGVESFNAAAVSGALGFYTEPRNTTFFRNARYLPLGAPEAATWLVPEPGHLRASGHSRPR